MLIFNFCLGHKIPVLELQSYELLEFNSIKDNKENLLKKQFDTKKRKNVITYYYGDELIRKKTKRNGGDHYTIILQGNAQIQHEDTTVFAPYIEIDPEDNGIIKGRIIVTSKKQDYILNAQQGTYSRQEELIKIYGNPYMKLNSKNSSILVATEEIERKIPEKTIIFKNYVKIFSKDWSLLADESTFYDDKNEFILKKNPVLIGKNIYFTAIEMIYNAKDKKIITNQEPLMITTIVLQTKEKQDEKQTSQKTKKEKEENKEEKENMIITADWIEYILDESSNTKHSNPELTQKGMLKGNVLMTSLTKTLKGEEFLILGKEVSYIESNKKVTVEDKKENFFLQSQYMLYNLKNRKLLLKQNPELIIYKKNSSVETTSNDQIKEILRAEMIERDFANEITIAKGNVYFKREKEEAIAEYAKIDEKQEKIELLGNPILKREKSEIHCKKIEVYKDRIEIFGELLTKIYD